MITNKNVKTAAIGMSVAFSMNVSAEWIQSVGQSERCIALGGACVAKSGDFGAYYHNPAAAADFDTIVFGTNLRLLDTTNLELKDSDGGHDIPNSSSEGDIVIAPTLAGYWPITDSMVLGLGFGAPFAITADWTNKSGIHRYNMSDQALFLMDLTPTLAYEVNDKLSFGLGINIVAFKHLNTETLIPNSFGAALPPSLGGAGAIIPTTPTSPIIGSITIQTDEDFNLGIPPDNVSTAFDEFAVTLGVQYQVNDDLTLGAMYRSKTESQWKGDVKVDLTPAGGSVQKVPFELDLDMPAHLQVGLAYDFIPDKLLWSFDVQWTEWSDAKGIGSPAVFELGKPLLGFINNIELDYSASDTYAYRTGLEYKVDKNWSLLAGYAFEEAIFDDQHVDILTYDTDRQLVSAGVMYDQDTWSVTAGLQAMIYEDRQIQEGQSQNLGGVSLPNLLNADTLTFTNNRGDFEYGGFIWAFGVGFQKKF